MLYCLCLYFFNADMKECLDSNKFSILGRVQEKKDEG